MHKTIGTIYLLFKILNQIFEADEFFLTKMYFLNKLTTEII